MINPPAHKFICPKCNYSKIVSPKSDALDLSDYLQVCPKCNVEMKKVELSTLSDEVFAYVKDKFGI